MLDNLSNNVLSEDSISYFINNVTWLCATSVWYIICYETVPGQPVAGYACYFSVLVYKDVQ